MELLLVAARSFWAVVELVLDVLWWRDDWNRTWSPVSWWLMAFFAAVLLILLYVVLVP